MAVSVVQHDAAAGTNQLDAARQAAQAHMAAREQAVRRLAESQETIRELQTQLAHERLARDEAAQRAVGEKETAAQELTSLRAELLAVRATLQQSEQRLRMLLERPVEDLRRRRAGTPQCMPADSLPEGVAEAKVTQPPAPARRQSRRGKVVQPEPESDVVEWWKPGWKERLR